MGAFASRQVARPDYRVLVATLDALQSASPAARALRANGVRGATAISNNGLVALLLGEGGWREAVVAQGGCFHGESAAAAASRRQPK